METVSITFSNEEVAPFQLHENAVPDILLMKAWLKSKLGRETVKEMKQYKHFVRENCIEIDRPYEVRIKLKDTRIIKSRLQSIYEIIFFDGLIEKAYMQATFIKEVRA